MGKVYGSAEPVRTCMAILQDKNVILHLHRQQQFGLLVVVGRKVPGAAEGAEITERFGGRVLLRGCLVDAVV